MPNGQFELDFGAEYPPIEKTLDYITKLLAHYEIPFTVQQSAPGIDIAMLRDRYPRYMRTPLQVVLTADFGGIDNELQGN